MKKSLAAASIALLLLAIFLPCGGVAEAYILLKGDLHCHSSFSHDSDVKAEQVIADSITAGYDFIALTEHNTLRHLKNDMSAEGLIVLAGYELTLRGGHYNVFGIRDFKQKTDLNKAELTEYLAYLHGLGALVQLDHPNDPTYPTRYGYEMDFEMLEVFNGVLREDDYQTLEDYQAMLCEGRKVIATGGTDAHKNHTVRREFNCVLATDRSAEAILEALGAGRVYVTTTVDGPTISLACGDAVMGATIAYAPDQTVDMEVGELPQGAVVKVYTDQGLIQEDAVQGGTYASSVSTEQCAFVRLEVWNAQGEVIAISNPIYIER